MRPLLLLLCLLALGCEKRTVDPEAEVVDHVLVLYLAGNNSLSYWLGANIDEAARGMTAEVARRGRIAVFYRPANGPTELMEIGLADGVVTRRVLVTYPEDFCAADPSSLRAVLDRVHELFPARSYGLVIGSHATGWFTRACLAVDRPRSMTLAPDPWEKNGWELTRTCCSDGSRRDEWGSSWAMEPAELSGALEGLHFDYLLFDACFMASVEALYDLRNCADYVIASAAEVMGRGFPYRQVIEPLFRTDRAAGLQAVCEAYVDYFATLPTGERSATIALVDARQLGALGTQMQRLARAGLRQVDPSVVQPFENMAVHQFFDLGDWASQAATDEAALQAFRDQLRRTVLYAGHTPHLYSAYRQGGHIEIKAFSGLTVNIPDDAYPLFRQEWLGTAWARLYE